MNPPDRPGYKALLDHYGRRVLTDDAFKNNEKMKKRQDAGKSMPEKTFLQNFVSLLHHKKIDTIDHKALLDSFLFELQEQDSEQILLHNFTPEKIFDCLLMRNQVKSYFNILQPRIVVRNDPDDNCKICGSRTPTIKNLESVIVPIQEIDEREENLHVLQDTIQQQVESHFNNPYCRHEQCYSSNCDAIVQKQITNELQNH